MTQPSFLQHAVYLNTGKDGDKDSPKSMTVLGQVSRRFAVSPDVDYMLDSLERMEEEARAKAKNAEMVID